MGEGGALVAAGWDLHGELSIERQKVNFSWLGAWSRSTCLCEEIFITRSSSGRRKLLQKKHFLLALPRLFLVALSDHKDKAYL